MIPEKLRILTNYKATEYAANKDTVDIYFRIGRLHINGAFIEGAEFMYQEMSRKLDIAKAALEEIANEDFRGNRPSGSVKAFRVLEEINK